MVLPAYFQTFLTRYPFLQKRWRSETYWNPVSSGHILRNPALAMNWLNLQMTYADDPRGAIPKDIDEPGVRHNIVFPGSADRARRRRRLLQGGSRRKRRVSRR
jgi:hypothetical protein